MPETIFGLPLHPLVVHATVFTVPLAALALAASLLSTRFRRWAGPLPILLAGAAVVLSPLSTSTGESLEGMVGETSLIERHAELGEMLVWWCLGLLAVAVVSSVVTRRRQQVGRGLAAALIVVGLVASAGTLVQVALVGHSGAEAVWSARMSSSNGARAGDGH